MLPTHRGATAVVSAAKLLGKPVPQCRQTFEVVEVPFRQRAPPPVLMPNRPAAGISVKFPARARTSDAPLLNDPPQSAKTRRKLDERSDHEVQLPFRREPHDRLRVGSAARPLAFRQPHACRDREGEAADFA